MRDSGHLLQAIHTAMVEAGLNIAEVYTRLGYDPRGTELRTLRTPHHMQAVFWSVVEAVTADPEIGLHLCPHMPAFHAEVIEYLFFSSPVFRDGCARALKYKRLISDALSLELVESDGRARILLTSSAENAPELRHTEVCVTYSLIRFLKTVTEDHFVVRRVRLHCRRIGPVEDYERIFGCRVEFEGASTEVEFDPAVLEYRSPRWDPDLLRLHEEFAERRMSTLQRSDLIERIRKVFSQRLELDSCDLDEVATELGMPSRRLRFELACAGTSFSQLLSDFRYALARRLLAGTDEPIERIVYLTGFSEPSTFYRAFKRWSGMTPVQYRDSRRMARAAVIGPLPPSSNLAPNHSNLV